MKKLCCLISFSIILALTGIAIYFAIPKVSKDEEYFNCNVDNVAINVGEKIKINYSTNMTFSFEIDEAVAEIEINNGFFVEGVSCGTTRLNFLSVKGDMLKAINVKVEEVSQQNPNDKETDDQNPDNNDESGKKNDNENGDKNNGKENGEQEEPPKNPETSGGNEESGNQGGDNENNPDKDENPGEQPQQPGGDKDKDSEGSDNNTEGGDSDEGKEENDPPTVEEDYFKEYVEIVQSTQFSIDGDTLILHGTMLILQFSKTDNAQSLVLQKAKLNTTQVEKDLSLRGNSLVLRESEKAFTLTFTFLVESKDGKTITFEKVLKVINE